MMKSNTKLFALVVVAASLAVACDKPADAAGAATATAAADAKLVKAEFVVEKMTCAACNLNVATAAKSVDGVTQASANADKKRAWVTFDANKTSVESIAAAITKAGYPAKRAPAATSEDGA